MMSEGMRPTTMSLADGRTIEVDAAPTEYVRLADIAEQYLENISERLGGVPDELAVSVYAVHHLGRTAEHYAEKCDELLKENDELRATLTMPDNWTPDIAPTYRNLAEAFVHCVEDNKRLQAELYKYYYHSHEAGKKKPTYNEWMGEATRLKQTVELQAKEIQRLNALLAEQN